MDGNLRISGKGEAEKESPLPDIQSIKTLILGQRPDADLMVLDKAHVFGERVHRGQVRKSGDPVYNHSLAVAYFLAGYALDPVTVAAGLLVDVIEDGGVDGETLEKEFGKDLASVIIGATKIGKVRFSNKNQVQAESYRGLILAIIQDIRVLLVRLADCCQNMRTLRFLSPYQQKRISQETMDIYVPLADRIGMNRLKNELEQLAFFYLKPKANAALELQMAERARTHKGFFEKTQADIEEMLRVNQVKARVENQIKSHFSIDRKMSFSQNSLDGVYDYYTFRIHTETISDCYRTLGLLHGRWQHIPGRIKDFIATPKANLYQSLHTTLISLDGTPFEVQIRTRAMHHIAENGITAHWSFKKGSAESPIQKQLTEWLKRFTEEQQELRNGNEYMENIKGQLQTKEVMVFTPAGDSITLPRGSTPLDFAYLIHTEVGHRAVGVKIDGERASLQDVLWEGSIVEILTDANQTPRQEWLSFVKTSSAKAKIKFWLRKREKARSLELGKMLLEQELAKFEIMFKSVQDQLNQKIGFFGLDRLDDFYAAIAYGRITPNRAVKPFLPKKLNQKTTQETEGRIRRAFKTFRRKRTGPILVRGDRDPFFHLSRCCNPIIGDPIVGFITKGKGISVHKKDCPHLKKTVSQSDRFLDLDWDDTGSKPIFKAKLKIWAQDRAGLLADVSSAIAEAGTNVSLLNTTLGPEPGMGAIYLILQIKETGQLERVLAKLEKIDGLIKLERK